MRILKLSTLACTLAVIGFPGCLENRTHKGPPMELRLYTGIKDIARLGDSETEFTNHIKTLKSEKKAPTNESKLDKIGFTQCYDLPESGILVCLRQGRVALVEVRPPFFGTVMGKNFKVFGFSIPSNKTWDQVLLRQFGDPVVKATGKGLGTEIYFYSWGDVTYNRLGPTEMAIYRDADVGNLRQKNTGKVMRLFSLGHH
jgi:hypothetical protein